MSMLSFNETSLLYLEEDQSYQAFKVELNDNEVTFFPFQSLSETLYDPLEEEENTVFMLCTYTPSSLDPVRLGNSTLYVRRDDEPEVYILNKGMFTNLFSDKKSEQLPFKNSDILVLAKRTVYSEEI